MRYHYMCLAWSGVFLIERRIFAFVIGGIGCAVYDILTKRDFAPVSAAERRNSRHRLHRLALLAP